MKLRHLFFALSLVFTIIASGCQMQLTKDGASESKPPESAEKSDQKDSKQTPKSTVHPVDKVSEPVTVTRVVDGDTVVVTGADGKEEKVRLLLIDTPESVHPEKEPQFFGKDASEYTKSRLEGASALLEKGKPEKDKYGRTLGYIWLKNGANRVSFNEMIVRDGYARVAYVFEPNTKYLDELRKAESEAKEKKLNIWRIDGYVTDDGFDQSAIKNRKK